MQPAQYSGYFPTFGRHFPSTRAREEGRLLLEKEAYVASNHLYADYRNWAEENDYEPENKATFTKELERLFGIEKKRKRDGDKRFYVYCNVKLQQPDYTLTQENIELVLNALTKALKEKPSATTKEIQTFLEQTSLSEQQTRIYCDNSKKKERFTSPTKTSGR